MIAADAGWPLHLNDSLRCATIMAAARFISIREAQFKSLGGYQQVTSRLNELAPIRGFIWREYSPASQEHLGFERRYFRESNAGRIDAMREQIRDWRCYGKLTAPEEMLLIADLLSAVNRVANIAGTFGCFMAKWTPQADEIICVRSRELRNQPIDVTISTGPVNALKAQIDDLVYLDPPYTKRQYASYYHMLETITCGDTPQVEGIAGLRPWRDRASDFCYKARALNAIHSLVSNLGARHVLLSYSDEAHVPIDQLRESLLTIGKVESHIVKQLSRYQPNRPGNAGSRIVCEYLFEILRDSHSFSQIPA